MCQVLSCTLSEVEQDFGDICLDPSLLLTFQGPLKYSSGFIRLMDFKRSNFLRHETEPYKKNIKGKKILFQNEREKII